FYLENPSVEILEGFCFCAIGLYIRDSCPHSLQNPAIRVTFLRKAACSASMQLQNSGARSALVSKYAFDIAWFVEEVVQM
ncbi:hypothetical protein ACFQPC_16605, partial [Herminiimonas glaciei]